MWRASVASTLAPSLSPPARPAHSHPASLPSVPACGAAWDGRFPSSLARRRAGAPGPAAGGGLVRAGHVTRMTWDWDPGSRGSRGAGWWWCRVALRCWSCCLVRGTGGWWGGGGVARARAVVRDVRPIHLPVCGPYLCHAIAVFAYLLVFIVFYFSVVCKLSLSASGRCPNPSTLASRSSVFPRTAPL